MTRRDRLEAMLARRLGRFSDDALEGLLALASEVCHDCGSKMTRRTTYQDAGGGPTVRLACPGCGRVDTRVDAVRLWRARHNVDVSTS